MMKILGGLGAMRRAKGFVSTEILQTMCQTLLLSHLDYCATAWLPSLIQCNKGQTAKLDRLLNRAARLITGYRLQDHVPVHTLLTAAGLESVRKRLETVSLTTVFKSVRGRAPSYMSTLFRWMSPPTLRVNTRAATTRLRDYDPHMLQWPPVTVRVTSFRGSLQYYGLQLWSKLPL